MSPRIERAERLFLTESGLEPIEEGEFTLNGGLIRMKDCTGVANPLAADRIVIDDVTGEVVIDSVTGNVLEAA